MKKVITSTLFLAFILTIPCFSQVDTGSNLHFEPRQNYRETALKLLIGGNLQQVYRMDGKEFNRKHIEIGLHKTLTSFDWHHPSSVITHGISLEVAPGSNTIYGFKYSAWAEVWFFVFGLAGVYYTDFDKGNFKIRPEIGVGMYRFKLSAGFNIPTIRNKDFEALQRSYGQVTLNILLKLKTLRTSD